LEAIGEKRLREIMEQNPGKYGSIDLDAFGHIAYGNIEFGRMMRTTLKDKLAELKLKIDMIDKDLGYELRCADPIPFDAEYTRNLGYGAVKYLTANDSNPRVVFKVEKEVVDPDKHGVVITFDGGKLVPRPFEHMIDPQTLKMRPRLVDIKGETYEVARQYMIRLEQEDFDNPEQLQKLAAVIKMTPQEFRDRFEYLVK
jgi:6-phosphofructokinase 1